MIIAMSRFRVKNDREGDVREAFLDRPRFVHDQGLEVFQDQTDGAAFYLVTRWSDKLDSAFTELRILERVEGGGGQEVFDQLIEWRTLTRSHLASSGTTHGIVATSRGVILATTASMERLLGGERCRLHEHQLWEFLAPESANELRSRVEEGIRRPDLRFSMTFLSAACSGGRKK